MEGFGNDVGQSNQCYLIDREFNLLESLCLRTLGQPIKSQQGLRGSKKLPPDFRVLGVGTTGSGRVG